MCGIFGHYCYGSERSRQEILSYLITGLKKLEYRGYDSAGIAVDFDVRPKQQKAALRGSTHGIGATATVQISQPSFLKEKQQHEQNEHQEHSSQRITVQARACHAVLKTLGKVDALEAMVKRFSPVEGFARDRSFAKTGHAGIAHTRWATHGPPCALNAHPHTSDANHDFVVVHNGIITNYNEIRDFLIKQGYNFVSETDTEVIPKLFKYVYDGVEAESSRSDVDAADKVGIAHFLSTSDDAAPIPFNVIAAYVLQKLEGAFAILVKSTRYPGELIACKRGSPMAFGIMTAPASAAMTPSLDGMQHGKAEYLECFIASDVSAFVEHTRNAIILEDDDLLHLGDGTYKIYNIRTTTSTGGAIALDTIAKSNKEEAGEHGNAHGIRSDVDNQLCSIHELKKQRSLNIALRRMETIDIEMAAIAKGEYEHFMAKEIFEQPETILQTLRGRLSLSEDDKASGTHSFLGHKVSLGGLQEYLPTIRRARRILFVGCGTSFNAALACRQTVEELVDVPVALELASDMMDRSCPIARDDVCVFVSQSGETADTLAALRYAKQKSKAPALRSLRRQFSQKMKLHMRFSFYQVLRIMFFRRKSQKSKEINSCFTTTGASCEHSTGILLPPLSIAQVKSACRQKTHLPCKAPPIPCSVLRAAGQM